MARIPPPIEPFRVATADREANFHFAERDVKEAGLISIHRYIDKGFPFPITPRVSSARADYYVQCKTRRCLIKLTKNNITVGEIVLKGAA